MLPFPSSIQAYLLTYQHYIPIRSSSFIKLISDIFFHSYSIASAIIYLTVLIGFFYLLEKKLTLFSFIFIIYSLNSIELFNIKLETNLSIFIYHSSTFMKKIYQKSEVFTSLFFPRHPLYYDLHLLDDAHHLQ